MSQTIALLFGFLTLVAVGIVISGFLRNPAGTKALGDATLGNFTRSLQVLAQAGGSTTS